MAGLEELKKFLQPLLFSDTDKGGISTRVAFQKDTYDSYVVNTRHHLVNTHHHSIFMPVLVVEQYLF